MNFSLTKTKIAVIGQGYVGLPLAVEFGNKFPTLGFDINTQRVAELQAGHDRTLEANATELAQARAALPNVDTMVSMREELRQLWLNTSVSREQLTQDLQAWCHRAEASGIAALSEFSMRLRAARA